MGTVAGSWDVKTSSPERVAGSLAQAAELVRSPAGALVFVSGNLSGQLDAVGTAVKALNAPFPVAIAAGNAVVTERGTIEDQSAAAGVIWSGGRAELVELSAKGGDDVGESLAQLLSDRTGTSSPAVLALLRPDGFGPSTLAPLRDLRGTRHVFGAGTVGDPGAIAVEKGGRILRGSLAMIFRGLTAPLIRTSHSCRLLGKLLPITSCRGAMLFEIDGQPALDVLASLGEKLAERPLVLVVLAEGEEASEGGRPAFIVRGIQGVDPDRGALVVSDEIREGMRITFAVRDGRAARDDLEAVTRELERDIAGAAPRFGIYVDCAGRGSNLYGAHDVDSKILRTRFPGLPFAGLASSFEVAPHLGRPTMQLYTGVFALFASPS